MMGALRPRPAAPSRHGPARGPVPARTEPRARRSRRTFFARPRCLRGLTFDASIYVRLWANHDFINLTIRWHDRFLFLPMGRLFAHARVPAEVYIFLRTRRLYWNR